MNRVENFMYEESRLELIIFHWFEVDKLNYC